MKITDIFSRTPKEQKGQSFILSNNADGTMFDSTLSEYSPLEHNNIKVFRMLREAIPVLSAAVNRIRNLIGEFEIETGQDKTDEEVRQFLNNVKVNSFDRGFDCFMEEAVDSTLVTGMSFSEIVLTKRFEIYSLNTAATERFGFIWTGGGYAIGIKNKYGTKLEKIDSEYVNYLTFEKRNGKPEGISIFDGLPFLSQIFIRMQKSWDNYTWRVGDPTFLIVVEGGENQSAQSVNAISESIKDKVKDAMQKRKVGKVSDVFGGVPHKGKVTIKPLGVDADLPNLEIPLSTIIEQIVSKTGLTPPLLGIGQRHGNYQVTKDQADMIVSDTNTKRKRVENALIKPIVDTHFRSQGSPKDYEVAWEPVNLMDEKNQAQARLFDAKAASTEVQTIITLTEVGALTQQEAQQRLADLGIKMASDFYKRAKQSYYLKQIREDVARKL